MTLTTENQRNSGHRRHLLWYAALVHRISGLLLVCFLPLHFLALGLAVEGEATFDRFLRWTDSPFLKFAETGLVLLLAVHAVGGTRLLILENLPWRDDQKNLATVAFAIAAVLAALFLLRLI